MTSPWKAWAALKARVTKLETDMNKLQTSVAALQSAVSGLESAVTANTFTATDVANIDALTTQVNSLTASFTPAPPPPPAS